MAKKVKESKERDLITQVKTAQTRIEKNMEKSKKMESIVEAKKELMQKYKENLPQMLKERVEKIAFELSQQKSINGLTSIEIYELLSGDVVQYGKATTYTAEQLEIVFEAYRKALVEINKKAAMIPTKENFCAFAGISVVTYNKWLSDIIDEEKMEVMNRIDDYIKDTQITSAQLGEVKEISTIFRAKASHNMVESAAPQVVVHRTDVDLDKVNGMIEEIKKGKSLKSIELKKNDEGTYE